MKADLEKQLVPNQEAVQLSPADEVFMRELLAKVKQWLGDVENNVHSNPLDLPPVRTSPHCCPIVPFSQTSLLFFH